MDKYKAKRSDTGEWVEGLPVHDINGNITEIECFKGFWNCKTCPINENTICRHAIGNLWENDIVEYEGKKGIIRFGKYEWYGNHYGFYVDWQQDYTLRPDILFWVDKVRVVGSVADDPDLLRGDGGNGTKTGR